MPEWLEWVRRLQSIAQAGLTYSDGAYDLERYEQIREIAAEIASAQTHTPQQKVETLYRHERGYSTPKVDVRGVVFNESDELLLVKEAKTGKWTLPGGWADVWDTPSQAAEREVREESGYDTQATRLLAVYDRDNQGHPEYEFAIYKIYFLCDLIGGDARTSHETDAVDWFAEDNLPLLDTGRTLEKHLRQFFRQYRQPDLPAQFD